MNSDSPNTADVVERLKLHRSWRDSHGELNDAPNEAAAEITDLRDLLNTASGFICVGGVTFKQMVEVRTRIRAALKDHRKAQV